MKKTLSLLLIIFMLLSLSACGWQGKDKIVSLDEVKSIDEYNIPKSELKYNDICYVEFGMYPQTDDTGNKKEPIKWFVIGKEDSERKLYLMSKDILDASAYDEQGKLNMYFLDTGIGSFLNNTFYEEAFSYDEKNKMQIIGDRDVKVLSQKKEYKVGTIIYYSQTGIREPNEYTKLMKAQPTNYAIRKRNDYKETYLRPGFWWSNRNQVYNTDGKLVWIADYDISVKDYLGIRPIICIKY